MPPPQPHCPPSTPKSTHADAPPIAPSLLLVSTAPQAQELPVTRLRNLGPFLPLIPTTLHSFHQRSLRSLPPVPRIQLYLSAVRGRWTSPGLTICPGLSPAQ